MKKKNIIIITISLLIIILAIFFSFKIYNFRKFSFNNPHYENLKEFTKDFNIKDTLEFKNADLKDNYIEYKNIKIENNYKDFTLDTIDEYDSYEAGGSYKKEENDDVVVRFNYGIENYTIYGLMSYMKAFSIDASDKGNIKRDTPVSIDDLFIDNNIKDDYDLIKYGYEHKDDELNIFLNSVKARKQRTYLYANLNMFLGSADEIYLIKGDLKGYMTINKNSSVTKVSVRLVKDDNNTYFFSWNYDNDYYTFDDIKNLLNSIEIS